MKVKWKHGTIIMNDPAWARMDARKIRTMPCVRDADGGVVAICGDPQTVRVTSTTTVWPTSDSTGEQEANAKLIAAAPELLECLVKIYRAAARGRDTGDDWPQALLAVIETVGGSLLERFSAVPAITWENPDDDDSFSRRKEAYIEGWRK